MVWQNRFGQKGLGGVMVVFSGLHLLGYYLYRWMVFRGFHWYHQVANIIAIPWVSFTTVPLALAGTTFVTATNNFGAYFVSTRGIKF
jgi:hypothetical protein